MQANQLATHESEPAELILAVALWWMLVRRLLKGVEVALCAFDASVRFAQAESNGEIDVIQLIQREWLRTREVIEEGMGGAEIGGVWHDRDEFRICTNGMNLGRTEFH